MCKCAHLVQKMSVSGIQCRAARALLGLSQREMAEAARVGLRLFIDFENKGRSLTPSGMVSLEKALTDFGIVLIDEPDHVGVKLRRDRIARPSDGSEP